jgi:hypothetical protein
MSHKQYKIEFDLDKQGNKVYFLKGEGGILYKTSDPLQEYIFEQAELLNRTSLIKDEDFELQAYTFDGKKIDYAVFPGDYVIAIAKDEKNSPPKINWNSVLAWIYENFDLSKGNEWDRLKNEIEEYFEPPKKKVYELEKVS